jgi:hypothetical protein
MRLRRRMGLVWMAGPKVDPGSLLLLLLFVFAMWSVESILIIILSLVYLSILVGNGAPAS